MSRRCGRDRGSSLAVGALLLAALACASHARAQDALWQAPPSAQRAAWFAGARAALEAENVVVRVAQGEAEECIEAACALPPARELGLSRAILLRVERAADPSAERVTLRLFDQAGRQAEASELVSAGDVASAVRTSYREAELGLELGEDALLRVRARPAGALVSIDGRPVGLAPVERKLRAGPHTLALALDGFAGMTRRLELARGRALEVELRLEPAEQAPSPAAPARDRASALNWILGGVLIVGSAPMLGSAAATLASEGHCARRDTHGACTGRVHFGTQSALFLGVGAAALAGGVAIFALAPFRVAAEGTPRSARITAQLQF